VKSSAKAGPKSKPKDRKLNHEQRVLVMALLAGLPGFLITLALLFYNDYSTKVRLTLILFIGVAWLGYAFALRERVVRPLQTLSNLLSALREGDYSIRARGAHHDDALGDVMVEVNALGETLREQRLGALEATALLRTVMAKIDVAVFAFDTDERLRLINRAGERLLAEPAERLLGRNASELGLSETLRGEPIRTLQITTDEGTERWGVSRTTFRERGLPHQLLVLSNLSRALREEERQAWRRLVRVLGHELNNSLAPIKSIAGSLETLIGREPRPADWDEDMRRGLSIIASRAESLTRFMEAYSRLARLPQPAFESLSVGDWVKRVVDLETRLKVKVMHGSDVMIQADSAQLDQLLINLLRNAVDASLETGGGVRVYWTRNGAYLDVIVEDEGPGLSNTANLFVPFFTTKPAGTGIGLVLSRQIAEAHGGSLSLENRSAGTGCQARLRLPL